MKDWKEIVNESFTFNGKPMSDKMMNDISDNLKKYGSDKISIQYNKDKMIIIGNAKDILGIIWGYHKEYMKGNMQLTDQHNKDKYQLVWK